MPGSPMPTGTWVGSRPWRSQSSIDLFGDDLGGRFARAESLVVGCLRLHLADDPTVARDHQGERLGPANVDADRDVTHD